MSEGQVLSEQEPAGLGLRRAEASTAGARLKALREASGLHIGMVAATLKVPQARLEALEADRLGDLPDATFARALAKAMCRVLKVDATEVLALLPASTEPGLERVSKGLNQPFRAQALGGEAGGLALLRKPLLLVPLALLLAAGALYVLPADLVSRWNIGGSTAASAPEPAFDPASEARPAVQTEAVSGATPASAVGVAQMPALMSTQASAGVPSASQSVSPTGAQTAAPASAPIQDARTPSAAIAVPEMSPAPGAMPSARPASAVVTAPAPATSLVPLRVRTTADSWIEVVDARGQVLHSRLMRAGELADLQVQTPVRVRVGNVSGTSLSLRGEAVDLMARSRDNVARLELP